MRVDAGSPHPLGATWDGRGTNFALFSDHAEKVELCLFDRQGRRELERLALPERTEDVWHGYVPDVVPGHEVVGELFEPVDDLPAGTRVVLEPVLSCAARGLEPCAACASRVSSNTRALNQLSPLPSPATKIVSS